VGNERYVFNIKGNHYRLVAMIFFNKRTLFIRFIGTHSDYDKIDCKTIATANRMITEIIDNAAYENVMAEIESYLQKATANVGFESGLSTEEQNELGRLAILAEAYEDNVLGLAPIKIKHPETIVEMIELKMYQNKWKQKDLASLLEISETRLSEVMQGKRKPNLDLVKKLHFKLNIEADFLLKVV
jgi:HTH-type transcriptional regulator / antitoxin HigA